MANKLFADSNRASLREVQESNDSWAETPTTGKTRARRFVNSSIVTTKETAVSDEIRDDRMVSSVIETGAHAGGDIAWEFAAGSQDNDIQRVLMGGWSRPLEFDFYRGKQVSITANNRVAIAGDDVSAYYTVGRRIKTSGFLTASNNDYLTITAVAFAANVTTITVAGTTLVVEAGSAFTAVSDANDVVILKSAVLRFGTTARTIDGNGANVFAAAAAAKQLVSGQRIFVEGVGYESGTITVTVPADGDTVSVSDGTNTFAFEAQTDSDVADVNAYLFAVGASATITAANLVAKINALRPTGDLNVVASSALGVVTVVNLNKVGGDLTSVAATLVCVAPTGGDADLGGFYTILSVTDDAIVVDRDVAVLAAGKNVTIKASMIRNPSKSSDIVPQSATVETGFQDVSQFFGVDGLRTGGISLDVASGAIIKGTSTTMGRKVTRSNTTQLGNATAYTVLDAAATENVSGTANVGALVVNGAEATSALQSLTLKVDGSLRNQMAIGSKYPVGIAAGRLNITGTVTAYFADGIMFDRFLDHESVALAFPIIDPDKNTYWFTIPCFKIMSDPVAPGGTDQDVMETMDFTAYRDAITKCMMQVDRFSSTNPVTAL